MTMADKIVVMNNGHVEQIGTPLDLYDRPRNMFVAGFIGSPAMNFLEGRIDGGAFRAADGVALPLPQSLKAEGADGRPIIYGIRPEHFQLSADGQPSTVSLIEPTGSETQVTARFAGVPIICAFRERIAARPGETIQIAVDPASVHLFDAGNHQRMEGG
jgi:multiple sugar transport system ATP-binding protein